MRLLRGKRCKESEGNIDTARPGGDIGRSTEGLIQTSNNIRSLQCLPDGRWIGCGEEADVVRDSPIFGVAPCVLAHGSGVAPASAASHKNNVQQTGNFLGAYSS